MGELSDMIEYENIPQSEGEVLNGAKLYVITDPASGLNE